MTYFRLIFPILLLFTLAVVPGFGQLNVKPAIIEVTLEHGKASGAFEVTNVTDQEVRVRAMPGHFELDRKGNLHTIPATATSLANWLKLNPREFTIAPEMVRQIRYALITPDSLPSGSYWCSVNFQPLPSAADSQSAKSHFVAITGILAPLLAEKGEAVYDWSIETENLKPSSENGSAFILIPVANRCANRIPCWIRYELTDASGAVIDTGSTPRVSVFPNSVREIGAPIPADLSDGPYDYNVTVVSDVIENTLNDQIHFEIPLVPQDTR